MLEPTLERKDAFWVLGIQERANPMAVDYGAFWARFSARLAEVQPLATEPAAYEVHFPTEEEGVADVFGGMAVPASVTVPEGLILREVPAAECAVFECTMSDIGATWGAIFGEWLPTSGYEHDPSKAPFEQFRPGCHEGTVPVQIFLPVRKRA
jgi:predicted transcriptional regulator YdeE